MSTFPSDTSKSIGLDPFKQTARLRIATLQELAAPAGRVLMSILFLLSGFGKVVAYGENAAYMESAGLPSVLLPIVIVTELAGAAAIVLGWRTRIAAFLLAGYSLLAALFFHLDFADPIQTIMFLKNVSIAGGLLLLVAHGAGAWSLDRRAGRE